MTRKTKILTDWDRENSTASPKRKMGSALAMREKVADISSR